MRALVIILTLVCAAAAGAATPFTKPARAKKPAKNSPTSAVAPLARDTVFAPPADSVAVAGYEKTLRSTRESMFVTNTTARPLEAMEIEVTYFDLSDRMLHRVSHDLSTEIPAGETRMIDVPSFDRQGLYYYHLSPVPRRAQSATPFKVAVQVKYIVQPVKH